MDRTRHLAISIVLLATFGLAAASAFLSRAPPLPVLGPACALVTGDARGARTRLVCEGQAARHRTAGCAGHGPGLLSAELLEIELSERGGACAVRPADQEASFSLGARLDLCLATEAELRMLPGIGEARAKAIVSYRRERGLERLDDLVEVPGIGPGTVRELRNFVAPQCLFIDSRPPSRPAGTNAPN